jgi:hypothetical protein
LIAYALLGTSRLRVVGPDTATGLISALTVGAEQKEKDTYQDRQGGGEGIELRSSLHHNRPDRSPARTSGNNQSRR